MDLLDKKVLKEMLALDKEVGLEGERLAEYIDKQTQLKLDQDAKEAQRVKEAAEKKAQSVAEAAK